MRVRFTTLTAVLFLAVLACAEDPLTVRCTDGQDGVAGEMWKAQWIWGPVKPNGPIGHFRKELNVRPGLKSATAQMSGDDGYTLYVNGKEAKQGGFWWKQTDTADLLASLHPGENVVAAEVGNAADPGGWLFELSLVYEDGSVELVATDTSWRFSSTPAENWLSIGFSDDSWDACVGLGAPPAAAPWGFLPHELIGPEASVEVVSATLPDIIEAGSPLRGRIELRPTSRLSDEASLTCEVKRGDSSLLRRSWKLEPPASDWPVGGLVHIELPDEALSRYLSQGDAVVSYGLSGVKVIANAEGQLANKAVSISNNRQGTITETIVKPHNGAPALFINGKPPFPMWFWQREILAEDAAAFQQAGVDVFTFCCPSYYLGLGWNGAGDYDYSEFDAIMLRFLEKAPNAYAVPRIFVSAPDWWLDQYPGESCGFANGVGWQTNGWGGTKHESFASEQWKQDCGEALRRFVRHVMESPYSDRVIGYHVANGIYGEWHAWSATDIPDTSEPMRRALVAHAKQRYQSDEATLQKAWGEPALTFETIAVPTLPERHSGDQGMFRAPDKSRKVADYYACLHNQTVDAIDRFCSIVKEESDRRLFTCVFYSYTPDLNWPQEGDHRAAARAQRLDSVDIFSSPHSYARRKLGEDALFRNYPAALALHGKLLVDEGDCRTYLANDPTFTHVTTVEQSVEVIRREFGNAVTHGTGLWYMDQQDNWFHDDALMAAIGDLKRWGDVSMAMPRESVAEVAVISTLDSEFHLAGRDSGINHVTFPLYDTQIGELCKSGAPFDWYLMEDLVDGIVPPHKVYIFLDAFYLTPERRAAIDTLKVDGHTLIWFYAPGYIAPDGLSLGAMEAVTGMPFALADKGTLAVRLDDNVATGEPRSYGTGLEQAPMFVPSQDAGAVWGRYADNAPALVVADKGEWRSVYSGVPGLPGTLLRKLYAGAGVHLYTEAGDVLAANASWVMLHTASAGTKTVRLREPARVYDIVNDMPIGEGVSEFSVDPGAGVTALFALNPPDSALH